MKVYHPSVPIPFDPYDVMNGIYLDDDNKEHKIDQDLADKFIDNIGKGIIDNKFKVKNNMGRNTCRICEHDEFFVAGLYLDTYIKCTKCGAEYCIHSG